MNATYLFNFGGKAIINCLELGVRRVRVFFHVVDGIEVADRIISHQESKTVTICCERKYLSWELK
jgi:hypothetical protein